MSSSVDPGLSRYQAPALTIGLSASHISPRGPLRAGPTPIIGREDEISSLLGLLRDVDIRLITLTGPAGVGKTRLAEEVASRARRDGLYDGEIQVIHLQTLRDAALVLPLIASAIGLDHPVEGDILSRLAAGIDDRRLLLVLDNIEQVVECAPYLSQLLSQCPGLTILATSRRSLNIRAEQVFQVAPLALPDIASGAVPANLDGCPSVRVLVQSVKARRRDFSITPGNAGIIASICHYLDGLPLALELAAARMAVLSPSALLRQLQSRVDILAHGPVDLPARHRRMHDAIAWSYDLLTPSEQWWFRRLSVLEGSFDLTTIQGMGNAPEPVMGALLDALTELVRANLVIPVGDERWPEPRFRMLETIRAFGLSLLFGSGEIDSIRRIHALHTLERLRALDGTAAHEFIETNAAGIRAALMWSWGVPDDLIFPQLIVALEPYWRRSADLEEGWLWMERAVVRVQTSVPSDHDRVTILLGASTLARRRADLRRAEQLASEGLRLATCIGSVPDMARALNALGAIATHQSAFGQARGLYQQALSSHRQTNDLPGEAVVLHNIALVTLGEHDLHGAIRLWEEAMPVARRAERKIALIAMLRSMGAVRLAQGRIDCAASFLHEALLWSERERDPFNAAVCHALLSMVDVERGNPEPAWAHGTQALKVARSVGEPTAIVLTLTNQADLERRRGDTGAADALLIEAQEIATGMGTPLALQPVLQAMGDLRHQQGAWLDAFEHYGESLRCWLQGGDMLTLVPLLVPFAEVAWRLGEEVMAARMLHVVNVLQTAGLTVPVARRSMHRALCLECGLPPEPRNPGLYPDVSFGEQSLQGLVTAIFSDAAPASLLSDRERAVLGLLVEGHTNAQMAEQLFVSPHTVNTHVRRIYQKMGVNSRSAATRFAMERGLIARPSARP